MNHHSFRFCHNFSIYLYKIIVKINERVMERIEYGLDGEMYDVYWVMKKIWLKKWQI